MQSIDLHFHVERNKYCFGSVETCIFALHFFTLFKDPVKMVKMFRLGFLKLWCRCLSEYFRLVQDPQLPPHVHVLAVSCHH